MRIGDIWEEHLEYEIHAHAYRIGVDRSDIVVVCNEMDAEYIAGECLKLSPEAPCHTDSKCPTGSLFLYTKAQLWVLHPEASKNKPAPYKHDLEVVHGPDSGDGMVRVIEKFTCL